MILWALWYICTFFSVRNGLKIVNKPIGILLHFIYSIFTKIRNKIEITVTKKGVPVDQFWISFSKKKMMKLRRNNALCFSTRFIYPIFCAIFLSILISWIIRINVGLILLWKLFYKNKKIKTLSRSSYSGATKVYIVN